jgi:hypothetical protein
MRSSHFTKSLYVVSCFRFSAWLLAPRYNGVPRRPTLASGAPCTQKNGEILTVCRRTFGFDDSLALDGTVATRNDYF